MPVVINRLDGSRMYVPDSVIEEQEKAYKKIAELAKKAGLIIAVTPNGKNINVMAPLMQIANDIYHTNNEKRCRIISGEKPDAMCWKCGMPRPYTLDDMGPCPHCNEKSPIPF